MFTLNRSDGNATRLVSRFLQIVFCSLFLVLFAANPAFADPPVAITQCGTVVSQPGHYFVANDLACPGTDGIDIVSDHVSLALDGHQIAGIFGLIGNGISVGIGVASGNSHVHIVGPGTITGFNAGINFEQVSDSSVADVTSTGNFFGFVVNAGFTVGCSTCFSTGNVFLGNTSTFNNQHGFTMNGASNNTFRANTASNNTNGNGILLFTATGNDVRENITDNNGGSGIAVSAGTGTGNDMLHNTATGNANFDLNDGNANCDNNTWTDNTFGTASQPCIH